MSEANPWRRKSSKVVYQNAWIRVREDQVVRPDGKDGIYGVVEGNQATAVIALNERGDVYLVGQYRYPIDQYSWEIIEGAANDGESALAAAQRELREEAGITAQKWEQLGAQVYLSNCFSNERATIFVARDLKEVGAEPDGTEVLKIRCVPFDEVLRMIDAGEITDSLTVIGMQRLALQRLRTGDRGHV